MKKVIDSHNAEVLKNLREEYNVSQSELADYLGYYTKGAPNKSVISNWESGKKGLNVRMMMLIRKFFEDKKNENR